MYKKDLSSFCLWWPDLVPLMQRFDESQGLKNESFALAGSLVAQYDPGSPQTGVGGFSEWV